ncbi:MAG: hypothetical protein DMF89_01460 [Acidobacteria bacterium]|nr:MAG: hypothetical protein DMF90_19490 [Acidobacteriota bacterium]PYR52821.1 MAG: hypothetical protein DMF89_01460 [Acidobacteriota bacterium]
MLIRHAAAVAFAVLVSPAVLGAQTTEFTVSTVSADVHNSPSTGSPVIGHASKGVTLQVTRELGSWVRIAWPDAPEGAYLHVSLGSINHGTSEPPAAASPAAAAAPTGRPASDSAPSSTPGRAQRTTVFPPAPQSPRTMYVQPPTHIVGIGGQIGGSTMGFGASARAWAKNRLGVQFGVSRYELSDATAAGRVTALQLAPSLLYSLKDRVTDFVVIRPYFGGGAGWQRQTYTTPLVVADAVTDNSLGFQAFGGSEFTFASMPRFAVSADLGYNRFPTPFAGVSFGGLGVSFSGHWYVH